MVCNSNIGTLNQINDFYLLLENNISNFKNIKKMEVEKKTLKNEDKNCTFSSIGIRKNFICKIKYINDDEVICCPYVIIWNLFINYFIRLNTLY